MDIEEERSVVARVVAGHTEEFVVLVKRYQEMVYALMCRQVGDRSIAEDLTQETFLRAYTSLCSFRGESSFGSWITRIALNQSHDYFDSKRHRQARLSEPFAHERHDSHDPGALPSDILEFKISVAQLRQALASLKPALREVLVLCGLEGRSYEYVAETLGIPVGTVRSRLNKARLLIKDSLLTVAAKELV